MLHPRLTTGIEVGLALFSVALCAHTLHNIEGYDSTLTGPPPQDQVIVIVDPSSDFDRSFLLGIKLAQQTLPREESYKRGREAAIDVLAVQWGDNRKTSERLYEFLVVPDRQFGAAVLGPNTSAQTVCLMDSLKTQLRQHDFYLGDTTLAIPARQDNVPEGEQPGRPADQDLQHLWFTAPDNYAEAELLASTAEAELTNTPEPQKSAGILLLAQDKATDGAEHTEYNATYIQQIASEVSKRCKHCTQTLWYANPERARSALEAYEGDIVIPVTDRTGARELATTLSNRKLKILAPDTWAPTLVRRKISEVDLAELKIVTLGRPPTRRDLDRIANSVPNGVAPPVLAALRERDVDIVGVARGFDVFLTWEASLQKRDAFDTFTSELVRTNRQCVPGQRCEAWLDTAKRFKVIPIEDFYKLETDASREPRKRP